MNENQENERNSEAAVPQAEEPDTAGDTVQPESPDSAHSPEKELEIKLAEEKTRFLRLAAEYDNYRKRSQKERECLFADMRGDVILQFLPVYDNLERALKQETGDKAFYKGVEMTMAQLMEIFEKLGVSAIPSMGEIFDPALHNAVLHIEDASFEDNEIVEEFQKGFRLGDKVIRFSTVKVAN